MMFATIAALILVSMLSGPVGLLISEYRLGLELSDELEAMRSSNALLEDSMAVYMSREGIEDTARVEYGYAYPGDHVVMVDVVDSPAAP